jgi:hypothetical protein
MCKCFPVRYHGPPPPPPRLCPKYLSRSIFGSFNEYTSPISSVSIATGYRLDGRGSFLGKEMTRFSASERLLGAPSLVFNGYRRLFLKGQSGQGRESDHSPQSVPEMKNDGAVPPLSRVFMSWSSIN